MQIRVTFAYYCYYLGVKVAEEKYVWDQKYNHNLKIY